MTIKSIGEKKMMIAPVCKLNGERFVGVSIDVIYDLSDAEIHRLPRCWQGTLSASGARRLVRLASEILDGKRAEHRDRIPSVEPNKHIVLRGGLSSTIDVMLFDDKTGKENKDDVGWLLILTETAAREMIETVQAALDVAEETGDEDEAREKFRGWLVIIAI